MKTFPPRPTDSPVKLLDVRTVADLLDCSTRHVYRLSDAGRMPAPIKLGSLVRWSRTAIEDWIAAGCRSCGQEAVTTKASKAQKELHDAR